MQAEQISQTNSHTCKPSAGGPRKAVITIYPYKPHIAVKSQEHYRVSWTGKDMTGQDRGQDKDQGA